jgi:heat shock protein HslJ
MKQPKHHFYFGMFFLLVISCNTTDSNVTNVPSDVIGTWELDRITYDSGDVVSPPKGTDYWIQFTADGVSAQADCNSCGGEYTLSEEGDISAYLICSRAACGISSEFSSRFNSSQTFFLRNEKLYLAFESKDGEHKGMMIFIP